MSDSGARETFPPIRRGMDVYNANQDRYLGTVISVTGPRFGEVPSPPERRFGQMESEPAPENISLLHEQGGRTGHAGYRGNPILGEQAGPVPTAATGNSGPQRQSASRGYATGRPESSREIHYIGVRTGRVNLGPFTPLLYIPGSAIVSTSMERIVVDLQNEQVPPAWRRKPG
ncbi:MAG: hypothetical protein ACRDFX_07475 [Chloroflexota bacterium]